MKSFKLRNISGSYSWPSLHKALAATIFSSASMCCAIPVAAQGQTLEVDTGIFIRNVRELEQIDVTPGKEKYSRKNNPAVELINTIRKNHKKGDPRLLNRYSYDQYDKITLGLLDVSEEDLKKHQSLKAYLDTTAHGRRQMLRVLLNEKASTSLYSEHGKDRKSVVRGRSSQGISEMFDVGNIEVVLEDFLREIDIYDNDITLMTNRFPSPLSSTGDLHYRYYISDTLDVAGTRCIQLTFMPRNPADYSFSGNLYVAEGDTTGFIRKVSMKVPRTVNLNFIDNIFLEQTYVQDSLGFRHKTEDKLDLDICLVKGTQRFSAERKSRYDNFSDKFRSDLADAYKAAGSYVELIPSPDTSDTDLLSAMRGNSLSGAEASMDGFMSDLRQYRALYWAEKVLVILVNGYVKTGHDSKFDFGPINTLISANPIEGARFRLGGMTTANLSPNLFANGYVAYGTRDRKWKYKGELEYSFNKKKYYSSEYPVHSVRLTHMYDLDMIGQHYLFTNADNVFLSLKRKDDKLGTYRHLTRLLYTLELPNNISFSAWGEHVRQDPTVWLPFIRGNGQNVPYYRRTSVGVSLRFAPGEKFTQDADSRFSVNRDAPVFQVSQEWGPKGLRGCHYSVCKTELSAWKRFWFSSFGYLDALAKGGIIWSQVPYTELLWPNANLSYTIQPESYSLMNPMEFAIDRYASLDITYWGNGVLFNRLPVIKRTGLREAVEFKCLWGGLNKRNDPTLHSGLFQFPADAGVRTMGSTPYMEISAGLDNIFRILRIDYVWRLSYLDTPGIDRSGLRVALHFNF